MASFGAAKYTRGGWRTVDNGFRRYIAAGLRHTFSRKEGEIYDSESHLLHLSHAAWNSLAALEFEIDRIKKESPVTKLQGIIVNGVLR